MEWPRTPRFTGIQAAKLDNSKRLHGQNIFLQALFDKIAILRGASIIKRIVFFPVHHDVNAELHSKSKELQGSVYLELFRLKSNDYIE